MRRKIRRSIAMAMVGLSALTMLAGCGGGDTGTKGSVQEESEQEGLVEAAKNTTKTEETLTVMLNAEPDKFFGGDPNEGGGTIANAIADSVLEYDGVTREVIPGICEKYEKVDDLHYLFTVRSDAKFSDGSNVTAKDIVYSLGLWKESGSSNARYFNMDETTVVDDKHFNFALTEYVAGWEVFLAEHSGAVVSHCLLYTSIQGQYLQHE